MKKKVPIIRERYVPMDKKINPNIDKKKLEIVIAFGEIFNLTNM